MSILGRGQLLLVLLFAVGTGSAPALAGPTPGHPAATASVAKTAALRPADLQADVTILERTYREMHPGLLRYLSPREADEAFAQLRKEFRRPRTVAEAYLAFARFTAKIRCGHTYANFYNQPKSIQVELFESSPLLPFHFRWIDGEMVVTRDFTSASQLPIGTEISRINGVATAQILTHLLPLTRADGSNNFKRVDQLNVLGEDRYESFDVYFSLLFPMSGGTVDLVVRPPGAARPQTLRLNTTTYAERLAAFTAGKTDARGEAAPLFEWRDLPDGSGYLRMPTWAMFESKWAWQPWLNERLDALASRNAPALIADLRGNEGGNDVGDEILKRLVTTDLPLGTAKRLVRYRAVPPDLLAYLQTWDPSFKDWGRDATELESPWPTAPPVHYYALAGDDPGVDARTVIHPSLPHFSGRLFVLIDAANSSATFQFAQVVRQQRFGTLIGEPTGGSRRGINGGAFFFLQLPHSGIELDVPLIGTFPRTLEPVAGLLPDIAAPTTAASIAAGADPAMAAVAALLAHASAD